MQPKNIVQTAWEDRKNHTINLWIKPQKALSEPTKARLSNFLNLSSQPQRVPSQIYSQELNLKAVKRILTCCPSWCIMLLRSYSVLCPFSKHTFFHKTANMDMAAQYLSPSLFVVRGKLPVGVLGTSWPRRQDTIDVTQKYGVKFLLFLMFSSLIFLV